MRRILICTILLLSLCGCGFLRETTYVVVEPHQETYVEQPDSDVLTANSYLSLKNAILSLVQDGIEEGVIRAESYSGNLSVDLNQAVNEVSQSSPLGAYAVSNMTYDYSRIVSYYEIHININFRRSLEEIQSVTYVTDMDALRRKLVEAMESYDTRLVLRVGEYAPFDLEAWVEEICLEHPEFALERPETSMEQYPASGAQRILELQFSYAHSGEELAEYREIMEQQIQALTALYGNTNGDMTNARRLYARLGRDALLEQDSGRALSGSAYGVLEEGSGTSLGFAQGYRLLLEDCGIPCELIAGQKDGVPRYLCRLRLDGVWYYADPSLGAGGQQVEYFLMGDRELAENGYAMAGEQPPVELPTYLRPPEEVMPAGPVEPVDGEPSDEMEQALENGGI